MFSIVTAASGGIEHRCTTAGLVVNNSAVLVDIPTLAFTPVPSTWYYIDILLGYSSAVAAGLRLSMTDGGGGGGVWADTAGNTRILNTPMNIAGGGVAAELAWWLRGYYNPGGAPGTFKLQAAQWVADPSNTTISVGSHFMFKRVA